ncbi:MAG: hypothetical protein EA363_03385, partial [Balneolaceae bacterium]
MLKTRISAALSPGRQTASTRQTASNRQTVFNRRILSGQHPASTRMKILLVFALMVLVQSCRTPEPVVTPEPEPVDPREVDLREAVMEMVADIYETQDPVRLAPGVRIRRIELDDE